ncbi:MAG: hypothetical protein V1922_03685 [bacterium]
MTNEALRQIAVTPQIPHELNPFRPSPTTLKRPKFITNGSKGKAPYLQAIGIDICITDGEIKAATDRAEDKYHARHGDSIIGPYMTDKGIPYPLVLASEKMKAAVGVMQKNADPTQVNNECHSSFITHDACYMLRFDGHEGDEITIHKPKTPQDIERIAKLLYWASTTQKAHLYSTAGTVRYDRNTNTTELYSSVADLGIVQSFDMAQLVKNLEKNPEIALGTITYNITGFLVKEKNTIPVTVTRYTGVNPGTDPAIFEPNWEARPGQTATAEFSADTPENIQLAACGLIHY